MANVAHPMESLNECVDWVLSGRRQADQFKIGTEYERLAIGPDGKRLQYEGVAGIRTMLERLAERHGWHPYLEAGRPIALTRGLASISLEPAGQFELSGAPFATVAEMRAEMEQNLAEIRDVSEDLGITLGHVGIDPLTPLADVPYMPKGRYKIMRDIMPRVGAFGLHMMHQTCTVQTNLDFSSAAECAEMLRLGHLLSPVLIALFANSPILEGKETGFATFRAQLWTNVDKSRCDVSHFAFRQDAGIEDYVQWALDVPLYFMDLVQPDGSHAFEAVGKPTSFRTFFERGIEGRRPTLDDWELHISTLFPDVRLKRYIELRQADIVPPEALPALPALTKGLFYDLEARRKTLALLRDGDAKVNRAALRELACKDALNGRGQGFDLRELSAQVLELATQALQRQALASGLDRDAALELDPLRAIVAGEAPPYYERVRSGLAKNRGLLALSDGW